MLTVTKTYRDLPAAHRQPGHLGHCRQIHGHNWRFDIVFSSSELDSNGFIVDVGALGFLRQFLEGYFDHTLLLNQADEIPLQYEAFLNSIAVVKRVPNCGMEGLAEFVFMQGNALLSRFMSDAVDGRNLQIIEVTCWEDSKNRSTYVEINE